MMTVTQSFLGQGQETTVSTRETSIDTYNIIKEKGMLSGLRFKVYDALTKYGPCTANELVKKMAESGDKLNSRDFFAQRLSELRLQGVVREVDKRKCQITGYNAIVWEVTNELPTKYVKPMTLKQKYFKIVNYVKTMGPHPSAQNVLEEIGEN